MSQRSRNLSGALTKPKKKGIKVNIIITGPTGVGKSSTINALFNAEEAKIGTGPDPETKDVITYDFGDMKIWDTPGLGDGEADQRHSELIIDKLNKLDENGELRIDLILVLVDASSRDLGTIYQLINSVIIPHLASEDVNRRLLIALNQADVAMKGKFWNVEKNEPEPKLVDFLENKVNSIKRRVEEVTGAKVKPIYFAAGYHNGEEQEEPYNLLELMRFIYKAIPDHKRVPVVIHYIEGGKLVMEG